MTRKDYVRAAEIVRSLRKVARRVGNDNSGASIYDMRQAQAVEDAFVSLFRGDNPAFSEDRFRSACEV